jgi:subtilase family serine protease
MRATRTRRTFIRPRSAAPPLCEPLEARQLLSAASSIILHDDLQILKNSASSSNIQGFTPSQIRKAYGIDNITFDNGTIVGNGSGQTIAIVDAYNAPYISSDLGVFDAQFGIAAPPSFKVVNQSGGSSLPSTNAGWAGEISLDVEWSHAIAPAANILLVETNNDSLTSLLAGVTYARDVAGVSTLSMSWGGSEFFSFNGTEFTGETEFDSDFTTPAGHNGVTFVAAAGDSGENQPGEVEWPAVSPNVLSVGGTSLYTASDGTYQSETSWLGTSGGYSVIEPTPAYQDAVDFEGTRSSPDVAYVADPNTGVAIFDSLNDGGYVGWQVVGGTSVGSPQWAALIAIADQGRALSNLGTLDGPSQTLPVLYSLYGAPGTSAYSTYTTYFNDIIDPPNFFDPAGPGYDLLTGMGTPKAVNIVDALADITPSGNPTNPVTPTNPTLPASPIEATIVSAPPASAVGSTAGSVQVRLFNTDSTAFNGPISVALYAITGGSISSSDTAFTTIALNKVSLASNGAETVTLHFKYPTDVPNGSYKLAAAVTAVGTGTAPADAIAADSLTLAAPIVDLSPSFAHSAAIAVTPGHRKAVPVKITNKGNYVASGTVTISIYSATGQTFSLNDPLLGALARTINLLPGESIVLNPRFLAPATSAAGTYNLIAAITSSTRPPDVTAGDKDAVLATRA